MQVNCRSIYNKSLDFWNLINTYDTDVVIGTESWIREEISNADIFRTDYTTFKRDRHARGGGVFICVKNYIACAELWVDDDFEMIAVEVKGRYSKCTWGIVGIYRPPSEDMRVIEKLAERTGCMGNTAKRSIIGGDLNLPCADWNGHAKVSRGPQAFLNTLVWDNGYTQVVNGHTRCWTFTLSGPKVRSTLAVSYRGSAITAGCYWKWNGEKNVVSLKRKD